MKKSVLLLGLGLGLLFIKTDASASACYSDGCHLRSGVPWTMYFFDKIGTPLGSLPGDASYPIVIPESSFPVHVNACPEQHNIHNPACNLWVDDPIEAGCHVIWAWLRAADPDYYEYTNTWWSCWVGKEKGAQIQHNPPPGAVRSKPGPQKSENPSKKK